MRTNRQRQTSRQNGAKSTGPIHPAIRHGIFSEKSHIPALGEIRLHQREKLLGYLHELRPSTFSELSPILTIFHESIRQSRTFAYENTLTESLIQRASGDLGQAILDSHADGDPIDRCSRIDSRSFNTIRRAHQLLREVRPATPLEFVPGAWLPTVDVLLDEKYQQPGEDLTQLESIISNAPIEPPSAEEPDIPKDPVAFSQSVLGIEPDPNQVKVLEVQDKNIILNCSRQWGKSTVAAIKAVHHAILNPESTILVVSKTVRQSGELLLKAAFFLERAEIHFTGDRVNRVSLLLPNRSRILAVPGEESNIRGISAVHLLIIDEAARVKREVFDATSPMLATTNGQMMLLSTPWDRRGFFWEVWDKGDPAHWFKLAVPATECPRIPQSFLDRELAQRGNRFVRREYMCEFLGEEFPILSDELINSMFREDPKPDTTSRPERIIPSPAAFARDRLHFEPDADQDAVLEVQDKNIILNCCRQWGKSTIAAILAAHYAYHYWQTTIVIVCPNLSQAGELMLKISRYLEILNVETFGDGVNKLSFVTVYGTRIMALPGDEANIRGISAVNLLIIDEATRVKDEIYDAVGPMLATTNGKTILLSVPWAKSGFFYNIWRKAEETDWFKLAVKATDCPRISPEILVQQRQALGEHFFKQEYMCEFLDHEFQLFSAELIESCFTDDVKAYPGFAEEDEDPFK